MIDTFFRHNPMRRIPKLLRPGSVALLVMLLSLSVGALSPSSSWAQERSGDPDGESLSKPIALPPSVGLYEGMELIPESVRRSAPFARALYEMQRRAGTNGEFDVETRIKAFEQSQRDLLRGEYAAKGAGKELFSDAWTNIGLLGSPPVYSAGCTSAIAIDPSNANIIYAGATSGGIWKTTNAGLSWVALSDNVIPNLAIASLAIDPSNPSTIYAGTGNGYAGIDELTGTGLYKSTNAGGTWTRIGTSTFSGTVTKVLVHPTKSNIVFASLYSGGTRGVYRSTDGGGTWTKVFPVSGGAAGQIWDIVVGSTISGIPLLYFVEGANVNLSPSSECGMYKSVNEGATWAKISSGVLPVGTRIGRSGLAVALNHPERVFCLMTNPGGDTLGFFRSTDNGVTWGAVTTPATVFKPFSTVGAQGWYDLSLAVSPNSTTNHDTMYIGGIEGWVNRSDAAGWVMFCGYSDQLPAGSPHVDLHTIVTSPNGSRTVYAGSDGGIYMSSNAGSSWVYRSGGMVTNRFYHIGLDRSDYKTTWAGAQDQGTWKMVQGGSASLRLGGDGMQPIQSWGSSAVTYGELPNGDIYRTVNSGSSWAIISSTFTDESSWDMPLIMGNAALGSIAGYNILYAGRQHLWRTTDAGDSWSQISPAFTTGTITSVGISLVDERNIYIGMHGAVQLTTNAGTTWTSKSTGIPNYDVTSIVTTGRDTNFALISLYTTAAASARVMMTTNRGTSWVNVNGTLGSALPPVGVNHVALDSINPLTTWYAATDNGMYYTRDAGSHWSIAGSGLGLTPCRDVQVHPNKLTIRVATFGRGIWEANANILPVELSSLEYQKTSYGTKLVWHTDSERGNAGFYVERSINGGAFTDLSFIPGHGTTDTRQDYNYTDSMTAAGTYLYQLRQVDLDGTEHFSNHVEVHFGNTETIVYQAYPNPFLLGTPYHDLSNFMTDLSGVSPALATRFRFELPDNDDDVSLRIYDSRGRITKTLLDHAAEQAGQVDVFWDGTASDGGIAAAGAYFWVLETRTHGSFTNKLILMHK